MNIPPSADDFDEAARGFVGAVAAGDTEGSRAFLPALLPRIERQVRSIATRALSGVRHVDPHDIVQHVSEKLLTHPPGNTASGSTAAVKVLAWTKRVASNHITDLLRRKREVSRDSDPGDPAREPASPTDPEKHLAAVERIRRMRRVLGAVYPRGLAVLDLEIEAGDCLPSKEIAALIGSTPANVDQIKRRTRTALAQHLSEIDDE